MDRDIGFRCVRGKGVEFNTSEVLIRAAEDLSYLQIVQLDIDNSSALATDNSVGGNSSGLYVAHSVDSGGRRGPTPTAVVVAPNGIRSGKSGYAAIIGVLDAPVDGPITTGKPLHLDDVNTGRLTHASTNMGWGKIYAIALESTTLESTTLRVLFDGDHGFGMRLGQLGEQPPPPTGPQIPNSSNSGSSVDTFPDVPPSTDDGGIDTNGPDDGGPDGGGPDPCPDCEGGDPGETTGANPSDGGGSGTVPGGGGPGDIFPPPNDTTGDDIADT